MIAPTPVLRRALALVLVGVLGLTGCALGERPSLAEAPTVQGTMTGDELIDAVLSRFDNVSNAVFTGEYRAVLLFGRKTTTVRVAQSSPTRRSVTVGDIRYIVDGTTSQTCVLSTGVCEQGIKPERTSDTAITTPELFFGDLAKRLRRDALAKVGDSEERLHDVGDQTSTCVIIVVDGGRKEYCALDSGVVAKYVGADITIDLTSFRPTADDSLFSTS